MKPVALGFAEGGRGAEAVGDDLTRPRLGGVGRPKTS